MPASFRKSRSAKSPKSNPKALLITLIGLVAVFVTVMAASTVTSFFTSASPGRTVGRAWDFSGRAGGSYGWAYICVDRKLLDDRAQLFMPNTKCPAPPSISNSFEGANNSPVSLPLGNKYFVLEAALTPKSKSLGANDKKNNGATAIVRKVSAAFPAGKTGDSRSPQSTGPAASRGNVPLYVSYTLEGKDTPEQNLLLWLVPDGNMRFREVRFPQVGPIRITKMQVFVGNIFQNNYDLAIRSAALVSDTPGPRSGNLLNWNTGIVTLTAGDFGIEANGKKYYAKPDAGSSVNLHSDPTAPLYATLESDWKENGTAMRLYMYFETDGNIWKVHEVRTYGGNEPGKWLYYDAPMITAAVGKAYEASSLTLKNNPVNTPGQTGMIRFENLKLKPYANAGPGGAYLWQNADPGDAKAVFQFAYNGNKSVTHYIDISTSRDMTTGTYADFGHADFGSGAGHSITVNSPRSRWAAYNCDNKPLYWRLRQGDYSRPTLTSVVQTTFVNCGRYPGGETKYFLDMHPSGNITTTVDQPTTGYTVAVSLRQNDVIVTDQRDMVYTWSIDDPAVASITPTKGGNTEDTQCTYGITPPCPYDYVAIHSLKPGLTHIHVQVAGKSNPSVSLASAVFTLTVNPAPVATSINLTSPQAGQTVKGVITLSAEVKSSQKMYSVEFYAGSDYLLGTVLVPVNPSIQYDTGKLVTGATAPQTIPFYAKAYDYGGNKVISPLVSVTVLPNP